MFAVSRIIAAVARTHLLPPFLAKLHSRFGTPWIATLLQGIATAMIALFTGGLAVGCLYSHPSPAVQQLLPLGRLLFRMCCGGWGIR
jgi:APA family basic amino acid/polyamine antiporter